MGWNVFLSRLGQCEKRRVKISSLNGHIGSKGPLQSRLKRGLISNGLPTAIISTPRLDILFLNALASKIHPYIPSTWCYIRLWHVILRWDVSEILKYIMNRGLSSTFHLNRESPRCKNDSIWRWHIIVGALYEGDILLVCCRDQVALQWFSLQMHCC